MAQISRVGYGQVELNFVSAGRIGGVYASRPYKGDKTILEQGTFLQYDPESETCKVGGKGEYYMVYNEEEHYDEREPNHKDYAMKAEDFIDGKMYPRLLKISVGDIFTTNTFGAYSATDTTAKYPGSYQNSAAYTDSTVKDTVTTLNGTTLGDYSKIRFTTGVKGGNAGIDLTKGKFVTVDTTPGLGEGYLKQTTDETVTAGVPLFQVIKEFCLADGQPAVKLQRIA